MPQRNIFGEGVRNPNVTRNMICAQVLVSGQRSVTVYRNPGGSRNTLITDRELNRNCHGGEPPS